MRLSPLQSTTSFLKYFLFFSVTLTFGGGVESYLEPCQTSKMERVAKIVSGFLFLQSASPYIFDRVLNTPLGWRKAFWKLLEWPHWLGIFSSKESHKSFQIHQYLKHQSLKTSGIGGWERPLYVLYTVHGPRDLLVTSLQVQVSRICWRKCLTNIYH